MKISDEIRQWCDICCDEYIDADDCDELRELADRIDRETVKLPLSADGKIWTGREECFWTGATKEDYHHFACISRNDGWWYIEDSSHVKYAAEFVWYERPDSFERIADDIEAAEDWCDQNGEHNSLVSSVSTKTLGDWADRIRKLADKEDER